eukprot:EC718518.1.p1 GENE.EC718518.1~~EC718518.1.p1  ORF type:complete len:93 (+),score=10.25 EC718518.1:31-279(+)
MGLHSILQQSWSAVCDFIPDDRLRFCTAVWVVHVVSFTFFNLLLYFCYHWNLFAKYKVDPDAKYPDGALVQKALDQSHYFKC